MEDPDGGSKRLECEDELVPDPCEGVVFNSKGLPKRPGMEECAFYSRSGECKFGLTCRYNHSETLHHGVDFNSRGLPLRPGQPPCEFYSLYLECKFGATCKNHHFEVSAPKFLPKARPEFAITNSVASTAVLTPTSSRSVVSASSTAWPQLGAVATSVTAEGYPSRPGQAMCMHFQKTGTCSFGPTCKFNHGPPARQFPIQPSNQLAIQGDIAMRFKPKAAPQLGQFSAAPQEHKRAPPAGMTAQGLPMRPGEPVCPFYEKHGNCNFGATCKYNHPPHMAVNVAQLNAPGPAAAFNSTGNPLRPGFPECTHYLKHGSCSFSTTCRFHHPEGMAGSQPDMKILPKTPQVQAPMMRAIPY